MARAVYLGEVPPLRLGFSSFVTGHLLQSFRDTYCGMFPGCEIKLTGGDPAQVLQRINQCTLDCAILPMPIDNDIYHVQQISQSPLVICMRGDDPLAQQSQLDIHQDSGSHQDIPRSRTPAICAFPAGRDVRGGRDSNAFSVLCEHTCRHAVDGKGGIRACSD